MSITIRHNDLSIELFDDPSYRVKSGEVYGKVIQAEEDKVCSPSSQHAINVFKSGDLQMSAIILASGGGTGIDKDSFLIDDDNLIIRCSNKLFSLTLPELEANWIVQPDWATCFSIHKFQDSYISHGEMSIARIDKAGKVLWSFSGADIFVCLYKGNPFEMHDEYIALTDFVGNSYKIDYDGNTLEYNENVGYYQAKPIPVIMKAKKRWWRFW